jgi:hypothetical protein
VRRSILIARYLAEQLGCLSHGTSGGDIGLRDDPRARAAIVHDEDAPDLMVFHGRDHIVD